MRHRGNQAAVAPTGRPRANHLGEKWLDEIFRLELKDTDSIFAKPGPLEQVSSDLVVRQTTAKHQRIGEYALAGVPAEALRILKPTFVAAKRRVESNMWLFQRLSMSRAGPIDSQAA